MPSQKKILVVTQHFWPENFRINDIVEGFLQDGIAVDVLCGLPNYPKGEWFPGYSAAGPFEEEWHGARLYRCKEVPRRGNTSVNIFLNYVSWPWYAAHALHRLPGGYDAVFCFNTSPVLMCWPAIRYAKKHHIPFTNYVLDIWPENLYSVLNVKNKALRAIAQGVSDALYKKADRLIAMSEPLQQRLCQRTGMPPQKIAVIPQYCEDFYAVPQPDAALQAQFGG
ncbi:MAG TPA: glycosyltransferase, partial [Gemmiger qucibialis]|nr:glycosyltransferase [Gemmiger qucibialis]